MEWCGFITPVTVALSSVWSLLVTGPTDANENMRVLEEQFSALLAMRSDVKAKLGSDEPLRWVSTWLQNVAAIEKEVSKILEPKSCCMACCGARRVEKKIERVRNLLDHGRFDELTVQEKDKVQRCAPAPPPAPGLAASAGHGFSFTGIGYVGSAGTIHEANQVVFNSHVGSR